MQQLQFINNFNQVNIFRAKVSPILRSTRLCLPQAAASSVLYTTKLQTQSSAPEDGRNYRTKHIELIEVINKLSVTVAPSWLFVLLYQRRMVTLTFKTLYYIC